MPITFQGGQQMPVAGSAAYNALVNSGQSGAGAYNASTGALSVGGNNISYSPTVVTDQSRRDAIPGMVNSANNYTGGNNTGGTNNTGTGGTNNTGTGTGNNNTDTSGNDWMSYFNGGMNSQNSQGLSPENQASMDLLNNMKANSDAVTASSIAAIQQQFQARYADTIASQQGTTAGLEQTLNLGGSERYAPVSSQGILSSKEKFDIQTLNDLHASENSQIATLKQAQVANDYKTMSDQLALLDKTRTEKITLASKIADSMMQTNKDNRDRLQSAIADASKTALANGAPKAVIDAINNAKSTSDAYSAAAGYGGGANIDVQKVTNADGSSSIVRVDKNTGKIIGTTNIGGGDPSGGTGGSTLSPTDYKDFITGLTPQGATNFNKLSPTDQSNVKQLINGDALLSDLFTSRGVAGATLRQQALQKAQAVDPTFSENTNKLRYNFMKQWNTPSTGVGKVNNSINTALGHLADTKDSSDTLDNEGMKFVNKASNWINVETGNTGVLKLKTDLTALATEVATIYKGGTQPSQNEIDDWKNVFSADYSKGQMSAVENEVSKLLTSKITASRYQYKTAMGKELGTSIIDPDKKQALIDAGIDPKNIANENVPGQPKTGVAAQIETALGSINPETKAQYTPDDVVAHLQTLPEYSDKIQKALSLGYKAQEILDFLGQ